MTEQSIIVILLAVGLSGVLVWLLVPKRMSKAGNPSVTGAQASPIAPFPAAVHYIYFPQVRQALSGADTDFLLESATPEIAKRAIRERRQVARKFLQGLREDFSNLEKLGRMIAALSPEVSREQETQRILLSLKFQLLYSLVVLRLSMGDAPLPQVERLTGLVGQLASRMDAAMGQITALSAGQLAGKISA